MLLLITLVCSILMCSLSGTIVFAQTQQQTITVQQQARVTSPIISQSFPKGLLPGYQLVQEGRLLPSEGQGTFMLISNPRQAITAVIVDMEKISRIKKAPFKSANPVIVTQYLLSRFFPKDNHLLEVTKDKSRDYKNQRASHLRVTLNKGGSEPAVFLRLIYPQGRTVVLMFHQHRTVFPKGTQDVSESYRILENQAIQTMDEIRIPTSPLPSERYMLWRLRQIYRNKFLSPSAEKSSESGAFIQLLK